MNQSRVVPDLIRDRWPPDATRAGKASGPGAEAGTTSDSLAAGA